MPFWADRALRAACHAAKQLRRPKETLYFPVRIRRERYVVQEVLPALSSAARCTYHQRQRRPAPCTCSNWRFSMRTRCIPAQETGRAGVRGIGRKHTSPFRLALARLVAGKKLPHLIDNLREDIPRILFSQTRFDGCTGKIGHRRNDCQSLTQRRTNSDSF